MIWDNRAVLRHWNVSNRAIQTNRRHGFQFFFRVFFTSFVIKLKKQTNDEVSLNRFEKLDQNKGIKTHKFVIDHKNINKQHSKRKKSELKLHLKPGRILMRQASVYSTLNCPKRSEN